MGPGIDGEIPTQWSLERTLQAATRMDGEARGSFQSDRESGFLEGLSDAGVSLHAREVGNFRMDEARKATLRMFAENPPAMLSEVTTDMPGSSCARLNNTIGTPAARQRSVRSEDMETEAAMIPST